MGKSTSGISRREFLRNAGVVVGGVAATSALAGCGSKAKSEAAGAGATSAYEVYDTDLLVIGGGLGATQTALVAFEQGANVMLVDKGPFRFSGSGGYNWDLASSWSNDPDASLKGDILGAEGAIEQRVYKAAYEESKSYQNLAKYMDHGSTLLKRMPDGSFGPMTIGGSTISFNVFARHDMDTVNNSGVSVLDRTMITQLLIQDGRCIGAAGLHLPTGAFRVFRAKQTIAAAGSAAWICGWVSVAARTTSGPDTTGDLTAIAYRNGCKIHQLEFCDLDTINAGPSGIAHSYNAGIGCDPIWSPVFCNKDGERFAKDYEVGTLSRGEYVKLATEQVKAGKGGPNGGMYVDLRDVNGQPSPFLAFVEEYFQRSFGLLKDTFGIDVRKNLIEVAINVVDINGVPVIDQNMQTEIPGLYFARSLPNAPSPMTINCGIVAAKYAAAQIAKDQVKAPENISWKNVNDEYARLQDILSREPKNPVRPHEVRHMIQKAGENLIGIRNKDKLEACIKELERIKTEELPRMTVSEKTKTYNIEWKQAIENYNMLDFAEMTARASLMRTETRGSFLRSDYPKRDDDNWMCWVGVKLVNGKMTTEKFPIDMSFYSADKVKQMLPPAAGSK